MAKREPDPVDPKVEPEDDSDDPNVIAKRMIDEIADRTEHDPDDEPAGAKSSGSDG